MELRGGFDIIWCLGDVVGYGPDPHMCIDLLRLYEHLCIAGNHDWAAIGKIDTSDFNPAAAQASHWTAEQLTPEDKEYLQNLPLSLCRGDFTLVHGSPREPIWEYILSTIEAQENYAFFETDYCLVGHSHVPLVFENSGNDVIYKECPDKDRQPLENNRLIINPGSVGQPRDGDPRASYAVYESEDRVVYHYRVDYDVEETQRRMMENGLPASLVQRLSFGW